MSVSIIVPIFNEVENIPHLYNRLLPVMNSLKDRVELILVDDGSTDGSAAELKRLTDRDDRVVVVEFRRNYGQTAAMQAGFEQATGDYIVTLDGDLQNEPDDIPLLLAKLDEGFDLVHGWRKNRHDEWLTRKLPSRLANHLISRVTKFPIHDLGCTLKAMRKEIADDLELYGEMHRFIPILAHWRGAKCAEVVTRHHARQFGKTKYGLSRTTRVVLDLITVKFMLDYASSPMKLFGKMGLRFFAAGSVMLAATLGMKVASGFDMTGNPLLLLGVMMCIVSVQLISLGLLGEVSTRIYYSREQRRPFAIRKVLKSGGQDSTLLVQENANRKAA